MMDSRLPREVRDMCYEHLMDRVEGSNFKVHLYHDKFPKNMWADKPAVFPWTYHWSKKPFFYEHSDFIGVDFARELVQMYYRKATFTLHERSFSTFDTWMNQDPFGYGLPVCRNLCQLDIYRKFDSPGMTFNCNACAYVVDTKKAMKIAIARKKGIVGGLAPLGFLRRRCAVRVKFGVWAGAIGVFQFLETVEVLIPIIASLKETGCIVKIQAEKNVLKSYGLPDRLGRWVG
ncbi:hypothetical protein CC80DRAFT_298085 [Byssothecium circinans]|uniref:Uncharacterized protein n=1 Tax=Byssothecium circinans TaxID=147558 RepID=A0A6A5T986_9PLEO|nr:hypothetical protein CC80DRAFT_298085 [Byssothecium circinans]